MQLLLSSDTDTARGGGMGDQDALTNHPFAACWCRRRFAAEGHRHGVGEDRAARQSGFIRGGVRGWGTGLQPPSRYGVTYRLCVHLVADVVVRGAQVPGLGIGPDIPPYLRSSRARLIRREEVLKPINASLGR